MISFLETNIHQGSLIVFGVMLSYWIDLGFSFLEPSTISWRFPIAFQIAFALFIVLAIPGLPESQIGRAHV